MPAGAAVGFDAALRVDDSERAGHSACRDEDSADEDRLAEAETEAALCPNVAFTSQDNESVTEYVEIPGRGHALTIDNGWRDVAETALAFVRRFA